MVGAHDDRYRLARPAGAKGWGGRADDWSAVEGNAGQVAFTRLLISACVVLCSEARRAPGSGLNGLSPVEGDTEFDDPEQHDQEIGNTRANSARMLPPRWREAEQAVRLRGFDELSARETQVLSGLMIGLSPGRRWPSGTTCRSKR